MRIIQFISVCLPLVLVAAAAVWWQRSKANEILRRWAQMSGVDLLTAQMRYLRTGPFFLEHARGQFVYRIIVRDSAGKERAGWVRVGGWLAGVLSEQTEVIWDS